MEDFLRRSTAQKVREKERKRGNIDFQCNLNGVDAAGEYRNLRKEKFPKKCNIIVEHFCEN